MQKNDIYLKQLSRIRSLNNFYHKQFLFDVRYSIAIMLSVYFLAFSYTHKLFLIVPYIVLLFMTLMAYHAHYLIFARKVSEYYENKINKIMDEKILIVHEIENKYFFPTNKRKLVVAAFGKDFSWFSFVTVFISALFLLSYVHSVLTIYTEELSSIIYFIVLILFTSSCLVTGVWWFIKENGESRIKEVLEESDEFRYE